MRRTISRLLLPPLAIALLGGASGCDVGSDGEDARGALPVDRLREGGHVLVFRHASTDSGMDTTNDLTDCSRQRNLDGEGRRQSRDIGRALRRLGIPVGRVLASPFCRTRDTARLAFGRVRASRSLLSPEFFASAREARRRGLRHLLTVSPRRGANTMLVTHAAAILAATGEEPDEGDALIVAPGRGPRGFAIVARVGAGEWGRLARGG